MPLDLSNQPVSSLYMPNTIDSGLQDLDFGNSLQDYINDNYTLDGNFLSEEDADAPWYQDVMGFLGNNWRDILNIGMSVGSGVVGYNQSQNLQDLARQAFQQSDPFAAQRGHYQEELRSLMDNPGAIFEDPAYIASRDQGLEAVERRMASQGYLGSGNMATALSDYAMGSANQYRQQRVAELMQMSGAGISPNFGAALGGYGAGSDLLSQALASLGYGVNQATNMGRPQVVAGGAGGSTPARGFNAAGGEAADYLRLLAGGTSLYGNLTGTDTSGLAGTLGGAAGIVGGASRGGVSGAIQAGRGAAAVGSSMGLDTSNLSGGLAGLAGLMGIRQGIQQGGIRGGITAGAGAAQAGTAIAGAVGGGGTAAIGSGAAANAALSQAGFGSAATGAGAAGAGVGAAGYLSGFAAAAPWITGGFAVADLLNSALGNNRPGWDTIFQQSGLGQRAPSSRNVSMGGMLGNGRLISESEAQALADAMTSNDQAKFAQLMQTAGQGFDPERARRLTPYRNMYQGADGFWYLPQG